MILVGERGNPFKSKNSLGQAVGRRRDECKIRKELRLYDVRGTCATRLLHSDMPMRSIAQHMGWSVKTATAMIESYASLNPHVVSEIVKKLG